MVQQGIGNSPHPTSMRPLQLCRWISLLLLTILLPSCGGSRDEQPTPTTPPSVTVDWDYTALGDSLAFGAIAERGYVPRYADFLRTDANARVTVVDLGVPGWTSADLLDALRNNQALRERLMNAEVVTFDVGGNDLLGARRRFREGTCGGPTNLDCFRTVVDEFKQNWDAILAELLALRSRDNTILRTMDVYNPFVAEQKALGIFDTLRPYLDEVNEHIARTSAQAGIPCARVFVAFNGPNGDQDANAAGLLALDLVHPNDNGHEVIAQAIRQLGYAPLR
jgi:lysophospholipase L1-like esterase